MGFELDGNRDKLEGVSPYLVHLDGNVVYSAQGGTVMGKLVEIGKMSSDINLPYMAFRPCVVYDADNGAVISERPTIVTNLIGIMRPLVGTLEDEVNGINKRNNVDKDKRSSESEKKQSPQ